MWAFYPYSFVQFRDGEFLKKNIFLCIIFYGTPGIFKDIIQIEVDLPPSHPIFDKFIFDKVLIMLTSLPPLEFLTKIVTF